MPANVRTVGGNRFTKVRTHNRKRDAQSQAKSLRDRGFNARVTQEASGWTVWQGAKR